jgi:hypothetical protein
MWDQLEPTTPHVAYLTFSSFLLIYALFSLFIRDHLHVSEPPLAVIFGIILGPYVLDLITPDRWGMDHAMVQELTRVIGWHTMFRCWNRAAEALFLEALEISSVLPWTGHDFLLGHHFLIRIPDFQTRRCNSLNHWGVSLSHRSCARC